MALRATDAASGAARPCGGYSPASLRLHRQVPPANGRAAELERFKFGQIFDASSGVVDIPGGTKFVATFPDAATPAGKYAVENAGAGYRHGTANRRPPGSDLATVRPGSL